MKKKDAATPSRRNSALVSVIIPTYNRQAYVREAIESVLSQTYSPFELLVVDDGSTDDTPALLKAYQGRIKVLRQSNHGVSAARNLGIRSARGAFIALLDSDDYWQPDKLALQMDWFDTHPEALICQTEEIWIRNGVRINPGMRHKKQAGYIFEHSLALCLISPSAVMMHTTLLEEMGLFDESLPACEDYDLWLRVTSKYPVGLVKTPAIVKRGGHADQLSAMQELDKYRIHAIVKILQKGGLSAAQKTAALEMLTRKCRIYATGCRKRGRNEEAHTYMALPERFLPESNS
jgi:glycosyltransferase involved in cell wall biosynthesis